MILRLGEVVEGPNGLPFSIITRLLAINEALALTMAVIVIVVEVIIGQNLQLAVTDPVIRGQEIIAGACFLPCVHFPRYVSEKNTHFAQRGFSRALDKGPYLFELLASAEDF